MKKYLKYTLALMFCVLASLSVRAQTNAPSSLEEIEKSYTEAIEKRTADILKNVALTDEAKNQQLHDIIIKQYRTLRARDEAISTLLRLVGKEINYANRAKYLQGDCRPIHDQFLAKLSEVLTPEQVEKIKDRMTYNKTKITFDAYCSLLPDLKDADKTKIMESLKAAREEAMDAGSAPEKTEVFQKYKDQINASLTASGYDIEKALRDAEAKQALAKKTAADAAPDTKPAEAPKQQ